MGDPMTITTWPKHQNLFYLVNSSGVSFEVKAQGYAAVGLARKPSTRVDYWIGIADNHRCWIKKDEKHCISVPQPHVVNSADFTKFWLKWNAGSISLGKPGDPKPILTYTNELSDLKYITFSVLNHYPVHWRFDLPPIRPKVQEPKRISGGGLTWVEPGDQIPDGALIGGFEKEVLYIIRAQHQGSLTPGKFMPSEGGGYISWGGEAHEKGIFQVLCGYDCTWKPTYGDKIPVGAVIGGHSEDNHEILYVGRAMHNGHIIPGKVQPSHRVCYIPFEGREIAKKKYEILVETNEVRSANDMYFANLNINSQSDSDPEDDQQSQGDDDDDNEMYGYISNDEMNVVMAF